MQAGAMGLPCIASDINGCNEIIIDGRNGIIIPPKDTAALHKAMAFLLNRADIRQQMASVSREMIVSRYEQRLLWAHLLNEYTSCIAQVQSAKNVPQLF
jgi:glycosyltransferase involved in cell wall biosynthesis